MAARLFSDLASRVQTSAPGCPQPVVINYIRNAAIEACERTLAYRYVLAEITLTAGAYETAYGPPATTEVHAIVKADMNYSQLPTSTLEALASIFPYWPTTAAAYRSTPQYIVHFGPDTFYVAPTPDALNTYLVHMVVALKPLRTATGLEQEVFDELEDVIVHGALQHLLVLPEQTWTDRELAAYHAKQFIFKLAERRARVNLGAGRASPSVKQVPWA